MCVLYISMTDFDNSAQFVQKSSIGCPKSYKILQPQGTSVITCMRKGLPPWLCYYVATRDEDQSEISIDSKCSSACSSECPIVHLCYTAAPQTEQASCFFPGAIKRLVITSKTMFYMGPGYLIDLLFLRHLPSHYVGYNGLVPGSLY